jgi:hypothetical protein
MPLRIANFAVIGRGGVAGTDTVRQMHHQTSAASLTSLVGHDRGAP